MAPITDAITACRAWLDAAPETRPFLLAAMLPDVRAWAIAGGTIERAELVFIGVEPAVALTFRDGEQRTPRLFDAAAAICFFALTAFAGEFRFNKDHKPREGTDERGLFYPAVSLPGLANLSLLRLIADAPGGKQVMQIGKAADPSTLTDSHYDLRRANLRLANARPTIEEPYPKRRTKRGRLAAIEAAVGGLAAYQKRQGRKRGEPITQKAYRQLLLDLFAELDRVPLGSASREAARPAA